MRQNWALAKEAPPRQRKKVSQKSEIYGILKIPAPPQTRAGLLRFIRPFHKGEGDFHEWNRAAFVYSGPEIAICLGNFH